MYDPIEVTTIAYARVTPLLMHTLFSPFFFTEDRNQRHNENVANEIWWKVDKFLFTSSL